CVHWYRRRVHAVLYAGSGALRDPASHILIGRIGVPQLLGSSRTRDLQLKAPTLRAWCYAFVLFSSATAAMLHQQLRAYTNVPDLGDPLFSMWRLAWVAHQLPLDPRHLFDANIFHPAMRTLAYSDAMIVPALIGAPALWLGV